MGGKSGSFASAGQDLAEGTHPWSSHRLLERDCHQPRQTSYSVALLAARSWSARATAVAFPIPAAFGARPGETRRIGTIGIRLGSTGNVEDPACTFWHHTASPVPQIEARCLDLLCWFFHVSSGIKVQQPELVERKSSRASGPRRGRTSTLTLLGE